MATIPVIDIVIHPEGSEYRLTIQPGTSAAGRLFARASSGRSAIYPVKKIDRGEVERFMWQAAAPFSVEESPEGTIRFRAEGRAATCLGIYLDKHLRE